MLKQQIISFFQTSFPLDTDARSKWMMVLIPGIFAALFLNIFQPFTIHNPQWNFGFMLIISGYGAIASLLLFINEFGVRPCFPSYFTPQSWTVGRHLLWFGWHLLCLSFGIYAYWKFLCCGWMAIFDFEGYPMMLFRTFAVGIFPVSALMSWDWIKSLKTQARSASDNSNAPTPSLITLTSEYHNEQLRLLSSQVLYLEAADNYVAVYFQKEGKTTKKLIRSSLSRMEKELDGFPQFLRCHRSYIINLEQVVSVRGNSKKREAQLRGLEEVIPIARKKADRLQKSLASLSN